MTRSVKSRRQLTLLRIKQFPLPSSPIKLQFQLLLFLLFKEKANILEYFMDDDTENILL